MEIFKNIEGYEGQYQVSNYGRIVSIKENRHNPYFVSQTKHKQGYLRVKLNKKTKTVHRLVAKAFVANPYNLKTVNHKDLIKDNNMADNLEWMGQKENVQHYYKNRHKLLTKQ